MESTATLPAICRTEDIAALLARSPCTVARMLRPYKRHMISTRPYTMTRETAEKILNRQIVPEKMKPRRGRARK